MHKLNQKQINELFANAKRAKERGETLLSVFKSTADKYSLSYGGVRNLYYKKVKESFVNGISVKKIMPFSAQEEDKMLRLLLRERKNCSSMREAFLKIANGDENLASRYQNKYSAMLKNNRQKIMKEVIFQKKISGSCFNPYMEKNKRLARAKLRREIDDLIKTIAKKCAYENELLKSKLIAYDKLCESDFSLKGVSEEDKILKQKDSIAKDYFLLKKDKNGKVN